MNGIPLTLTFRGHPKSKVTPRSEISHATSHYSFSIEKKQRVIYGRLGAIKVISLSYWVLYKMSHIGYHSENSSLTN